MTDKHVKEIIEARKKNEYSPMPIVIVAFILVCVAMAKGAYL